MDTKYEIKGKKEVIHLIAQAVRKRLEDEKYTLRAHLAEPMYEKTVYEYQKNSDVVVVTLDDDSFNPSTLTVRSEEVDTFPFMRSSAIDVIRELVSTCLKPMTKKAQREELLKKIEDLVDNAVSGGK